MIKTLANCSDIEFLRQTNRIRKAVKNWMDITDILAIRQNIPDLEAIPKDATEDEKEKIAEKNRELQRKQAMENLDAILDNALEKYPEETAKIIRLCCFVAEDDDSKHIGYYMAAFADMFRDEAVIDFFTSLGSLRRKFGLTL